VTVLIGICHFGAVDPMFISSFEEMDKPDCVTARTIRSNTPSGRTILVRNLLHDVPEASHLFFMDDDMLFPKDALTKLLARDVDIVSGFYVMRGEPWLPVAFRNFQDRYIHLLQFVPGLQEVDACGAGCLLIKRGVFERMTDPYFTYSNPRTGQQSTEDMMFCEVARSLGYKIWLDFDVKCKHLAIFPVGYEHYVAVNQGLVEKYAAEDTEEHRAALSVIPWTPAEQPEKSRRPKIIVKEQPVRDLGRPKIIVAKQPEQPVRDLGRPKIIVAKQPEQPVRDLGRPKIIVAKQPEQRKLPKIILA
jgi:hypothetical protein